MNFKHIDPIRILTLKAYGDFVIAANVVAKITPDVTKSELSIISGMHTKSLAKSMGVDNIVTFLGDERITDVPPIFDLKNHGLVNAAKSLRYLQIELDNKLFKSNLIVDHLGLRERLIGLNHTMYSIAKTANNIYIGYFECLKNIGYKEIECACANSFSKIKFVTIIPGARSARRKVPLDVIYDIVAKLRTKGIESKIVINDGDYPEAKNRSLFTIIPLKFPALIEEIKKADLIISADSLPAHLSEYYNIPCFILTPIPNWTKYWLPKSSYLSNGMGTFQGYNYFFSWLDKNFNY